MGEPGNGLAAQSTATFRELVGLLGQIEPDFLTEQRGVTDELSTIEGYRYVCHLLGTAFDFYMEGDPERPRFTPIVSPGRKFLGDNPDALYLWARIRGDRSYRIRGRRNGETYLSVTIHGRDPEGGHMEKVIADINDRDLDIAPDGTFELVLSPDEHPGNWIRLAPEAVSIITRHYFLREQSAAADPDTEITLRIDPIDDPGPVPVLDDATFAERLGAALAFVRANTLGRPLPGSGPGAPFVSPVPNDVGTPYSFRQMGSSWGAVDIFYSSGPFDLGPDEALVMEGTLPEAAFVNVVLWNMYMQTLDYRTRRCSLNSEQLVRDAQGRYRIVIAGSDPGVPNWIDTQGHRTGTIFWRFCLPETDPEKPVCKVVPLADVKHL